MKNYIGVFDSGIGGLTVLKEIKKILPNENYLYYADSINNPYGEKNDNELYGIVKNIVINLIKENCKLIVIACNTATTRCIKKLREEFPNIDFVGTEPAIKVAFDHNYKNTLVMATPGTISSERLKELINLNIKKDEKVYLVSCEGLANAIENNDKEKINNLLHKYLDEYKDKNIDAIVLGCTHYPIIEKEINSFLPNSKIITGNIGIANRVNYILEQKNIKNNSNIEGKSLIIKTKKISQ